MAEDMSKYLVNIKTVQSGAIRILIESLKEILTDTNIIFDETGVKLIAVDQSAYGDKTATTIARTVTVSAKPQQVAALAQAQSTGRLSLALVGSGDTSEVGPVEVDQMSLLGLEAPEEEKIVEVEKEEVCTIRTRKGGEMIEIPIPCTN